MYIYLEMGYIYLITNTINYKKYIGQTLELDINRRWNAHKNTKKGCPLLKKAFLKYGIDKFKFQIICICFDEDCNKFETEYIQKYNSLAPNGYNLMTGGGNSRHLPETLLKISEASRNRKYNPITEEVREKIRQSKLGNKSYNFGKHISDEQKQKIRETWRKKKAEKKIYLTEEVKINLERGRKIGTEKMIKEKSKPVGQYSLNNELINSFCSSKQVQRELGFYSSSILKVCNGKR